MLRNADGKRPADNVLATMMAWHWAILPESLETMVSIAERTNVSVDALEKQRGEPLKNAHDVTMREGVATIPVTGPMFRYASFFSRISGATAYEDLATDFHTAVEDPRVKAIVLAIDSPGGEVNGNDELAQMVFAARGTKPILSYVSHLGASAAYWLASAADEVVISPTSILGSIGTVATLRKSDKADRNIEIVSTQSPNKRLDPETDVGRASILKTVDALAQVFVERVATYRGVSVDTVLNDFGQGGVFVGQAAIDAGLADRMGSYEAVLGELRDRASKSAAGSPFTAPRPLGPRASISQTRNEAEMKEDLLGTPVIAPASPAASAVAAPPAPAPVAAATPVVDIAAIRAEAQKGERERIAAITALRKAGNETLIAQCIEDSACSIEMAKARLYDHERVTGAAQLTGLRADEAKTPAPKNAALPSSPGDLSPRAAGAAAVELHRSLTSSTRSRK